MVRTVPAQPADRVRRRRRWVNRVAATVGGVSVFFAFAPIAVASACPTRLPTWRLVSSAGTGSFRSIDAVSRQVVWLGSDDGTVLRTVDGGRSWRDVSPTGTASLHFRDLHALNAREAVAMTAGTGGSSRVYRTTDGGRSWQLAYHATDAALFFDSMEFFDSQHGLIMADPEGGKFQILATGDAGRSWTRLPDTGMPVTPPDEYGFADSGTTMGMADGQVWFGTGGSAAQVFHSGDKGRTWDVSATPVVSGSPDGGAGILGLAFRSPHQGLAVGGNLDDLNATSGLSAYADSRQRWSAPAGELSGLRFAAAWLPNASETAVAVGLNGSDVSFDGGRHWTRFDDGAFDTTTCASDGSCWAAGDTGRVAVLRR